MSKTAGHALMRHVANRFGPVGIRANVIAPGVITHPRFETQIGPELAESMMALTPIRSRLGAPEPAWLPISPASHFGDRSQRALWKMTPSTCRCPLCTALTPCRSATR
jgi:NAD(P)-dependent dehydrogenase (short-subunit alcohol dehydrogenase family)